MRYLHVVNSYSCVVYVASGPSPGARRFRKRRAETSCRACASLATLCRTKSFCVPDLDAHRQAGDSLSLYFPRVRRNQYKYACVGRWRGHHALAGARGDRGSRATATTAAVRVRRPRSAVCRPRAAATNGPSRPPPPPPPPAPPAPTRRSARIAKLASSASRPPLSDLTNLPASLM
jgi:hypothetical protein